jgi:hypothetical protein
MGILSRVAMAGLKKAAKKTQKIRANRKKKKATKAKAEKEQFTQG